MLDIRLIREKTDQVKERLATRDGDCCRRWWTRCWPSTSSAAPRRRNGRSSRATATASARKSASRRKKGEDTSAIEAEVRGIGERIDQIGKDADALDAKQRDLLLGIPNLPHDACPGRRQRGAESRGARLGREARV